MLPKVCPACHKPTLTFNEEFIYCTSCPIYKKHLNWVQRPLAWAYRRQWWWRIPILGWFVSMLMDNLRTSSFALSRLSNPFSALDLGMHELGHILFSPFGEFMRIAGGSIFQCLFPIMWLLGFIQKRWYFAASMCLCWLGLNLFDVATYVADARARELPLAVGIGILGIDPSNSDAAYDHAHDWYQLLSRTNSLESDLVFARGLRIAATVIFVTGLLLGSILVLRMISGSIHRLSKKTS